MPIFLLTIYAPLFKELRPQKKCRPPVSKRSAKIDTLFLFTKEKIEKN